MMVNWRLYMQEGFQSSRGRERFQGPSGWVKDANSHVTWPLGAAISPLFVALSKLAAAGAVEDS